MDSALFNISLSDVEVQIVDPVPAVLTDGHTLEVYWCCRTDGDPYADIELPNQNPFLLVKVSWICFAII